MTIRAPPHLPVHRDQPGRDQGSLEPVCGLGADADANESRAWAEAS
jgi:hypothetical protein